MIVDNMLTRIACTNSCLASIFIFIKKYNHYFNHIFKINRSRYIDHCPNEKEG